MSSVSFTDFSYNQDCMFYDFNFNITTSSKTSAW